MGSVGEKNDWHPMAGMDCQSVQDKAFQVALAFRPTHCATFDTRCTPLLVTREEIRHDFSYSQYVNN